MTNQPHDRLVKAVFSDARQAVLLLDTFLPRDIRARIDASTLQLVPGSFVDEELTEVITDLLFKVEMDQERALIYVLFEHQSTPDRAMPLRFLRTEGRIWQAWLRQNPKELLPPILPLALYHGAEPWNEPIRLSEMIQRGAGSREALAPYLPEFRFLLADLSGMTDDEIKARVVGGAGAVFGALALLLLRNCRDSNLLARLLDWPELLVRLMAEPTGLRALETLVHYVFEARGESVSQEGLKALCARAHASQEAEETVMNLAEKLRAEGRLEGRLEGRQEGREAEARESLLRLLRLRFGELDAAALARIQGADLRTLQAWLDRVLGSRMLGDVLA